MSKIRMFNMHPTQAFLGHHHGETIIHQPKKGRWAMVAEKVANDKSSRGYSIHNRLKCVDPNATERNWVDVPASYAKIVKADGLGPGRLQPSFAEPMSEKVDVYHHGGFLKTQDEVDIILESEHAARERKLAELEASILEKQKTLEAMTLDAVKAAEKAAKAAEKAAEAKKADKV